MVSSLRVLHSSDLHGKYKRLLVDHADTDFDVWLDTGDFFDNKGRVLMGHDYLINPHAERTYQTKWWQRADLGRRFADWLGGRPAIICAGNHDFIHLANALAGSRVPNVHKITTSGVDVLGLRWAGFREINYIRGEWEGEAMPSELASRVAQTLAARPDILVTHAPAHGVLDEVQGYGIPSLTNALTYGTHAVRAHFFGHCHADAGRSVEAIPGVVSYNGATRAILREIPCQ